VQQSPVILVVEDDHLIQDLVELALAEAGFEAAMTATREAAVRSCEAAKPTALLLRTSIWAVPSIAGRSPGPRGRLIPAFPLST
jgi:DNA-binding response OmpR family regulator